MLKKLEDVAQTYKDLQNRMADPTISANNTEFQKVAKAAAEIEEAALAFQQYNDTVRQLGEAKELLRESDGGLGKAGAGG